MARNDFDLQLTRYDGRGWRATFYVSGIEHSADIGNRVSVRALALGGGAAGGVVGTGQLI
jgi:hypothetical protein